MIELPKSKLEILQKTMLTTLIPESNTNQEEPVIHFTHTLINIANKTIPKTTIYRKHNKLWFTVECKNIRECQATLRKFKTNPSSENINKYKQQRAKTRHIIKEAKRSSWKTFISKINSNTNPKKIWDFIKKIANKNTKKPINHLSQGNTKAHNQPDCRKFCSSFIYKNYSSQFNSIRIKEEKNKIKFTSDNTESYNQPFTLTELQNSISKSNNLAPGPE